jgi:aminoglycoside phosphotransferase (APT) family kinase protein
MADNILDRSRPVRKGEELPIERIDAWLKQRVEGLEGTPDVTQYTGGASNWTYRLEYAGHDFVLRCPPLGTKARTAHDMSREYRVQKALMPYYPVPDMIAFCDDRDVMDRDFYVMEHMKGIIPRANFPKGLELSTAEVRRLCTNMIDNLVRLHSIDINESGLAAFGKGAGYVERQITGWCSRYEKARTWNVPKFRKVMNWLKENMPGEVKLCLIHNDYRFDNLILDPEDPMKIIGVLDWEMATIGDPLMDLGNSMAYWIEAGDGFLLNKLRRQPTHLPGMMSRSEVVEYYCAKMGFDPGDFTFYRVYGIFRLAVIIQQIYYRYFHKQTRNPAFRYFWAMVHIMHWQCKKEIRQG